MKEQIETRHTEIRVKTADPDVLLGKYTCGRVHRSWVEDFADADTGEIVSIDRNEVLFNRGTYIDKSILSEMQFYLQSGDVKEIEVSNQCRKAYCVESGWLRLCLATVRVDDKNRRFLFYAPQLETAVEVLKDYVELNYESSFAITALKYFEASLVLTDNLTHPEDQWGEKKSDEDKKFYQIDFVVEQGGIDMYEDTAIVHTFTVDRAMMLINDFLIKREKERVERQRKEGLQDDERELMARIESAKAIPVTTYIPREFSEAYGEENTDRATNRLGYLVKEEI